jgi:hypothetical protein
MKLSHEEVEVLVKTINPTVEYYYDSLRTDPNDETARRYKVLFILQARLEEYHDTTLHLESEEE